LHSEKTRAGRLDLVRWLSIPSHLDERGTLSVVESGIDLPFAIKRVYCMHHLKGERGGHAHRATHQLVVAVAGSCEMVLSDGRDSRCWILDDPARGLLLEPMLFIRIRNFSDDAAIVVLASTHYDTRHSIRSWEAYLEAIQSE
jgi:dTDP-4-dehydrorhamnose 3,5-epimerase-like enzyme